MCSAAAGIKEIADAQTANAPAAIRDLRPMKDGVRPISVEVRSARIEKAAAQFTRILAWSPVDKEALIQLERARAQQTASSKIHGDPNHRQ